MAIRFDEIVGVSRPARDALTTAGFNFLEDLDGIPYRDVLKLHGVGPRGLERLQAALVERGWTMKDAPAVTRRQSSWVEGHTGKNTENMAGAATEASPHDYVASLEGRRHAHGKVLLELFARATGEEPVMWGESMIGYGQLHYTYATGREGDTFKVGFSPRKSKISLYGLPQQSKLMRKLGKHTTGASCVYINKPEDVDLKVLEDLVREGYTHFGRSC